MSASEAVLRGFCPTCPTPRSWAKQFYADLFYWNELDHGGHFAAFEQPALFTQELRNRFRVLR